VLVELRGMMCVDLDGQSDLELPAPALAIRGPAGKGVGHRPGAPMETSAVDLIATAVAPIVMVSATGLLFIGVQTKNLHLADRVRDLMREYREAISRKDTERREALRAQIVLFERRIRLSQRALELLYGAIVSFVTTTLLLAVAPWMGQTAVPSPVTAGIFLLGIASLLLALVLEFVEVRAGLSTIAIETRVASEDSRRT
jgi:uncharacterized membrane protein (DUF485 family)